LETIFLLTPRTQSIDATAIADGTPQAAPQTFAELGVAADFIAVLSRAGITVPSPVQALTIPDVLAGRDLCGKARTGSGKTLAFGLPMLERTTRSAPRRPNALVLVPTRELASQVARALAPLAAVRRIRLTTIFGGASMYRQVQDLRAGIDLVVATPGRLNDLLERGDISVADVRTVVLDEADQMADMGFLPQVDRILNRIQGEHQTLLFSATLDGDVDQLVYREVVTEAEAIPTMKHRFVGVPEADKVRMTAAISAGPGRTLLFVRTQRRAERLVYDLDREGVRAAMLHGGLSQPQRERALRSFSSGAVPVLVATNIAARGIHVDDVETVVHHDPPEDAKTYLHRSGRTARAGAEGVVVTLVQPDQVRAINLLRRDASLREAIVSMKPDDPRLADLAAWEPPFEEEPVRPAPGRGDARPQNGRANGWGRGDNFRARRPAVQHAANRGDQRFQGGRPAGPARQFARTGTAGGQ